MTGVELGVLDVGAERRARVAAPLDQLVDQLGVGG